MYKFKSFNFTLDNYIEIRLLSITSLTLIASLGSKRQTNHCDKRNKQWNSYGSVFKMIITIQTIG